MTAIGKLSISYRHETQKWTQGYRLTKIIIEVIRGLLLSTIVTTVAICEIK